MKWVVALLAVVALAACEPTPVAAPRYGLDGCNQSLPGTEAEREADAHALPIVCEPHPDAAPPNTLGWWDGSTIHLWPMETQLYPAVLAHELGHAAAQLHPDWLPYWQSIRPGADAEDFANCWAWINYPRPTGMSYAFTVGFPTDAQTQWMRDAYGVFAG